VTTSTHFPGAAVVLPKILILCFRNLKSISPKPRTDCIFTDTFSVIVRYYMPLNKITVKYRATLLYISIQFTLHSIGRTQLAINNSCNTSRSNVL
jgi:hypothetical protein